MPCLPGSVRGPERRGEREEGRKCLGVERRRGAGEGRVKAVEVAEVEEEEVERCSL